MSEKKIPSPESIARALKPVKCPECGEEITHLELEATRDTYCIVSLDEKEELSWGLWNDSNEINSGSAYFYCPNCGAQLFTQDAEEEVQKFLKGEEYERDI